MLLWPLLCVWANAAVVELTGAQDKPLSLTAYLGLLEDPDGGLTLEQVRSPELSARFRHDQPAANALALGFTRSAYWIRLSLRNASDAPQQHLLVVENPRIAQVRLHQPDAQGDYRVIDTGCDNPVANRVYTSRNFAFPVSLAPGEQQDIYLRVASDVGLLVPLKLWSEPAFQAQERAEYVLKAWYFGIATAMFLFNLMLFIALRDRIYLLYVSFVASTACTLAVKDGLAAQLLPALGWLDTNEAYWSFASLTACALLLFMRRMLGTRELLPRIDRLLLGLVALYLVTPLVYAVALQSVARIAIVLNLLTVLIVLVVALVCALKRQRSARFFLAAFTLLMLGGVMTTLRAMGVLPTNVFTVDGLQLGSALEMLLLAFALADRINVMRKAKALAQQQLLQAQQLLVETLQNSERELEQRVAERTDQLQQLNQRLEALSQTDGLTGVANRRHFDQALELEWGRAQRSGAPLALAMLDVDWFKAYNDHYGHPAGDDCLRQIAATLTRTVNRGSDLVARYGGEEFVFLAPMTDCEGILAMARRVVEAIPALQLPHADSPEKIVTVSLGIAALVPQPGQTVESLLQQADEALYRAKSLGRNRAEA